MNIQKIGGLVVLLINLPLGLLARDGHLFFATMSIALMMIFFAKERVNDERVEQLKMKALFLAMGVGIGGTLLGGYYLNMILVALLSIPARAPSQTLTAYEFMSGVFLIALGLFHYWRWQDGRAERQTAS